MTSTPAGAPLTRLQHLVVEVPDPLATAHFLTEGLALHTSASSDSAAVDVFTDPPYAGHGPAHILTLRRGPSLRLMEVVFETAAGADLAPLAQRLATLGRPPRFVEGGGLAVEVGGVVLAAREASGVAAPALPASSIRPRRLGHVNILTPEPAAVVQTLFDGFGLRLSEQIGESFFFLRVRSEHHNIGVRTGPRGGAHHIALEVHGWDSYRVLCDRLAALGWTAEYGPGRHAPGRNLFVYVRDPSSGLRFELFSDMVHIEDEQTYQPPKWRLDERHKTVNVWGPAPPESFLS